MTRPRSHSFKWVRWYFYPDFSYSDGSFQLVLHHLLEPWTPPLGLLPLTSRKKRETGSALEVPPARSGSGGHHVYPHSAGLFSHMAHHLVTRKTGKCSLALCQEKGENFRLVWNTVRKPGRCSRNKEQC